MCSVLSLVDLRVLSLFEYLRVRPSLQFGRMADVGHRQEGMVHQQGRRCRSFYGRMSHAVAIPHS